MTSSPSNKAVVIWIDYANDEKGETKVFGPFESGSDAARFGFERLKGEEWFWEPIRITGNRADLVVIDDPIK